MINNNGDNDNVNILACGRNLNYPNQARVIKINNDNNNKQQCKQ